MNSIWGVMKKIILLFCCIVVVILLAGCAGNEGEALEAGTATQTPAPAATSTPAPVSPTVSKTDNPISTIDPEWLPTITWENEERKEGVETGQAIIEAIERYYQDTGIYPDSLNDLIPMYLERIPETSNGHGFAYDLYDDWYILKFPFTRRNRVCGYSPGLDDWECTHFLSYP